jgi:hypothetical protein
LELAALGTIFPVGVTVTDPGAFPLIADFSEGPMVSRACRVSFDLAARMTFSALVALARLAGGVMP